MATLLQIAEFVGGSVVGNPKLMINGVSAIDDGKDGTITFLANKKYKKFLNITKASAIISNDKKVLQEFKRVIRPGGLLMLGVPNEGCALAWFRNHVIQRSILQSTDHVNFYKEKSILKTLTDSNFSIVKIEKSGFFLPHLALHYLASISKPGRKLLNFLGKIFQSQSAELIVISLNK